MHGHRHRSCCRFGVTRTQVVIALAVVALAALGFFVLRGLGPIRTGRIDPDDKRKALERLPRVFVPNPAIESMVEALAGDGDLVRIHAPWKAAYLASGSDPAYWKPTADQIREIQSCDLIFLNGAGYEPWAEQAALPRAKTVDTTRHLKPKLIVEQGETHSHGPEGEHSHSGFASSTWLSPELAKEQLAMVAGRLYELTDRVYPANEIYADRIKLLDASAADLRAVQALQPKLLASHPVYQYLAAASGIAIDSMHWEPGQMPDEKEWTKFRLTRLSHPKPTAWMLWEGEPGTEIRARLLAEGVEPFVFPLFPATAEGDFLQGYADTVAKLRAALAPKASPTQEAPTR